MAGEASKSAGKIRKCPQCGAGAQGQRTKCWLCLQPLDQPAAAIEEVELVPVRRPPEADSGQGFSLSTLMLFVTLACVVFGVASFAPGLAVPLGVLFLAVWARTAFTVRERARRGESVSLLQKVQLFTSSVAYVVVMLVLISIAGAAALFAACAAMFTAYDPTVMPFAVGGVALAVAAAFGAFYLVRRGTAASQR